MLTQLAQEIDIFVRESKAYIPMWLTFLGGLWVFNLIHWMLGQPLNILGIWPRKLWGLLGIIFAPFLHGGFNHLFFNTIPLFVLGLFILPDGLEIFIVITSFIMLIGGLSVWLFARPGIHIGASAVIAGYFGYVLASAYEHPSFTAIALSLVALYYFGGILLSLFPSEEKVSWEGHLTGFLAGVAARFFLPSLLPF